MDGIATLVAPFDGDDRLHGDRPRSHPNWSLARARLESTNMVTFAFTKGLGTPIGGYIVILALILFAYTTILAWAYCGEKALEFLVGPDKQKWFRYTYIALVPIGSVMHVDMIWTLADIAITFMLFINLIGVMGLSRHVIDSSREFKQAALLGGP